jgi:hypothetical protein
VTFRGGISVGAGEILGSNSGAEIAVGIGPGEGSARIATFNRDGTMLLNFFAFVGWLGGTNVAIGEVSAGVNRICASPKPGASPRVRCFNSAGVQTSEVFAFRDQPNVGGDLALHRNGAIVGASSLGGQIRFDITAA